MFGGFFDFAAKTEQLEEIQSRVAESPDFWNDPVASAPILKEKKALESALTRAGNLKQAMEDLAAAVDLAQEGHEEYTAEAESLLNRIDAELRALEAQKLLGGELDRNDALVQINAGAGGTESCDWASMIFRMYLRFAERKGWTTEIFDMLNGEEAGIKNVSFQVTGEFAFGLLKAESGVHRLVRISPFDSNARRHTSFASVFVSAVIDDTINIQVLDSDLRVDTYRSSGSGGQHVNKTDSAVRLTHIPSGIVVACQTQRSQHQNRDQAMKLLKSRLYDRELETRRKAQEAIEGTKSDNSWGSQIRSYVLHPYKLVKDHRTDFETSGANDTLDGDLDGFIEAYLIKTVK